MNDSKLRHVFSIKVVLHVQRFKNVKWFKSHEPRWVDSLKINFTGSLLVDISATSTKLSQLTSRDRVCLKHELDLLWVQ